MAQKKTAVKKPAAKKNATEDKKSAAAVKYTRAQLLKAKRYSQRKDLINALLEDNRQYTIDEVDAAIEKFMKGKVE